MTIRAPMDPDLYEAAVDVLDAIERRLQERTRVLAPEDVLGADVAAAYARWQTLLVVKYAQAPDTPKEPETRKFFGENND